MLTLEIGRDKEQKRLYFIRNLTPFKKNVQERKKALTTQEISSHLHIMESSTNYYSILKISRNATPAEIEIGYRNQRNLNTIGSNSVESIRQYAITTEAYSVLIDTMSRLKYDRTLTSQENEDYLKKLSKSHNFLLKTKETEIDELKRQIEDKDLIICNAQNTINDLLFRNDVITKDCFTYKEKYNSKSGDLLELETKLEKEKSKIDFYKHQNNRFSKLYREYKIRMTRILVITILSSLFIIILLIINK